MKILFFSQPKQTDYGFSLVETLVVIGISSFIMLALARGIVFFYDTNEYAVQQSAAVRSASAGVESLVQDIREASFADNGAFPVEGFGTSSLTIYADVNDNERVERVHYQLNSSDLERIITTSTGTPPTYTGDISSTTVSDSVRNKNQNKPIFTFYDVNGDQMDVTDNRQDIAFISIELIVNIDPNRQPDNTTIKSSAALRNINKPS